MFVGIGEQFFARQQVPLAPRCDHFYVGHQRVGTKFKPNLIVALAGGAVRYGVRVGFAGDFHQPLGNQRARDRGAEQIFALIHGVGAEHGKHKVAHEFFAQIVDENIAGLDAHFDGFGARRRDFFALTDVGGEGDDFAVIDILQPLQDDGGVEATGVGEDDFFNRFAHKKYSIKTNSYNAINHGTDGMHGKN